MTPFPEALSALCDRIIALAREIAVAEARVERPRKPLLSAPSSTEARPPSSLVLRVKEASDE